MAPLHDSVVNAASVSVKTQSTCCTHDLSSGPGSHESSPNISCFCCTIILQQQISAGTIKVQLLKKAAMDATGLGAMWHECQAYDAAHAPDAKLDKVENYLSNECFPVDKQAYIDSADSILFVEEAYVAPPYRRQGLSLLGVDLLMKQLELDQRCVVLLQAGPINKASDTEVKRGISTAEAYEKIARHWRRMGFQEWSYTDDAWLCLATEERPKIEDVVPELFSKGRGFGRDASA